jgi:hypothetical protein|tara:strand:- start:2547 stop:2876 length:330 start_codon:yes stop_codon:yes gene_type:complete
MSIEAGGLDLLLKYVWIPTIGLLGWFVKGYLNRLDNRQLSFADKLATLELKLNKEYYDKLEIQQQIVLPLQKSISETRQDFKAISELLVEMHGDMKVLKSKILGEVDSK